MREFKKAFVSMPYSTTDEAVKRARVIMAKQFCNRIANEGYSPLCPVLVAESMTEYNPKFGEDFSYDDWLNFSLTYLKGCDLMYILRLTGWEESVGVKAEIELANQLGIEIVMVDR